MFKNTKDAIVEYYKAEPEGCISTYNVYSISDVYQILDNVRGHAFGINLNDSFGRPLWFRGQNDDKSLVPSLYRTRDNQCNSEGSYSKISLAEGYRFQNFSARVTHLAPTPLKSKMEWQELLQHHFGKTRFMDWSESVKTAISFALEAFIDTKDDKQKAYNRSTATPVVWVLNPYQLNEHIYDFFSSTPQGLDFIKKSLETLYSPDKIAPLAYRIKNELKTYKNVYFNFTDNGNVDITINGLINMCMLDDYYRTHAYNMANLLEKYEFNPFFYLLVRYYADALPVNATVNTDLLPPLASVQPYHSERIRAQRGTFTIFPNYYRSEEICEFAGTPLDIIPIDSQRMIADCFCKIRLCDPVQISRELISAGERRPEIYPDIQIYADYIETQSFFV